MQMYPSGHKGVVLKTIVAFAPGVQIPPSAFPYMWQYAVVCFIVCPFHLIADRLSRRLTTAVRFSANSPDGVRHKR